MMPNPYIMGASLAGDVLTGVGTHQGAKALAREKGAQLGELQDQRRKRIARMDSLVGQNTALAGTQAQRTGSAVLSQNAAADPTINAASTALGLPAGSGARVRAAARAGRQATAGQQAEQEMQAAQQQHMAQANADFAQLQEEADRAQSLWASREAQAAHKGEGWRIAGGLVKAGASIAGSASALQGAPTDNTGITPTQSPYGADKGYDAFYNPALTGMRMA